MREFVRKLWANHQDYVLLAAVLPLIMVPLTIALTYMVIHEGDSSKQYVPELKKISQEIPPYPNSQKTGEKVVLKRNMAYFFTWYKSNAAFEDVKSFYQRELPARGWLLKRPCNRYFEQDIHCADYQRGDYFIAVESDTGSDSFSIVFTWDPQ